MCQVCQLTRKIECLNYGKKHIILIIGEIVSNYKENSVIFHENLVSVNVLSNTADRTTEL